MFILTSQKANFFLASPGLLINLEICPLNIADLSHHSSLRLASLRGP